MSPVPDAALTITLVHDEAFTALASVSTSLSFPPGYERALRYALAVELAPEFGKNRLRLSSARLQSQLALINGAKHTTSICKLRHDANWRWRVLVC